jgi:hypothetical protein
MTDAVNLDFLRRQLAQAKAESGSARQGGDGPQGPEMNDERIGKLEGMVDGLKHGQTQLLVAIGIVAAFVIGFGFYSVQKIDAVNEKVNALPSQIRTELLDLTKTLADEITATKQSQTPSPKH